MAITCDIRNDTETGKHDWYRYRTELKAITAMHGKYKNIFGMNERAVSKLHIGNTVNEWRVDMIGGRGGVPPPLCDFRPNTPQYFHTRLRRVRAFRYYKVQHCAVFARL